MLLSGFLEAVERFQARGWAFDRDQPERHLVVELLVAGQPVGTAIANLYRADLEQNNIGDGDHCFTFNFPQPLSGDLPGEVTARVRHESGHFALDRWRDGVAHTEPAEEPPELITFTGTSRDDTQHPLFILGAARSGTTAVAHALLKATRYKGYGEGHVLDLLAELYVAVDRFYDVKRDEDANPFRATTLRRVPIQFFREGFDSLAIEAMRSAFPDGWWLDKTPTVNMIHISGRLRRIWPQAKFIFLKRRGLENVASRTRKFAETSFELDCREWADAMRAWRTVRPRLEGCALQIDQHFMARAPDEVAREIAGFLALDPSETERLRQALAVDRPERTGDVFCQIYDGPELDWNAEQWQVFNDNCGAELEAFGYSSDISYYVSAEPALRIQRI